MEAGAGSPTLSIGQNATNSPRLGRVKACNACRQSKLRCDAHKDNYGPCSRCRRLEQECVISNKFKRRNRQTKAELERELNRLRSQYEQTPSPKSATASSGIHTNLSLTELPAEDSSRFCDSSNAGRRPSNEVYQDVASVNLGDVTSDSTISHLPGQDSLSTSDWTSPREHGGSGIIGAAASIVGLSAFPSLSTPANLSGNGLDTLSRKLGDVELSARKINDCFSMFITHYSADMIGIVDYHKTPNQLYEYSDLLFWTTIYAGSRKYTRDPTVVESIIRPLADFIRRSLFEPDRAISTIQAVLILCLWPLPVNSTFKDQSHAISGAAMQLAIQKGLPYLSRKQDFVGVASKQTTAEKLFRARLWTDCLIIFQGTSLCDGLLFPTITELANSDQNDSIFSGLPTIALYRWKLHRIQVDAFTSIMRTTDLDKPVDDNRLNSLIDHFDTQAQLVAPMEDTDLGRFALNAIRLNIRAFHFFSVRNAEHTAGILKTYSTACDLLEIASRLDKIQDFGLHCTQMQARAVACAALCIIRVHRSDLRAQINTEVGEEMFFEVIRLCKKRSIQNNDLDARTAIILTQLWSSTRAFRFKDGTIDGLKMLLRGRLSMSMFFDSLWWWRAEFGGKSNPYIESEPERSRLVSVPQQTAPVSTSIVDPGNPETSDLASIYQTTPAGLLVNALEIPDWDWDGLDETGGWSWPLPG